MTLPFIRQTDVSIIDGVICIRQQHPGGRYPTECNQIFIPIEYLRLLLAEIDQAVASNDTRLEIEAMRDRP